MTNDLDNFTTTKEVRLWLFPDMLEGKTKTFLFKSYEIDKTKAKPWLIWHVLDLETQKEFKLSHYTLFHKARILKATEIHKKKWNLTKDLVNKSKFAIISVSDELEDEEIEVLDLS